MNADDKDYDDPFDPERMGYDAYEDGKHMTDNPFGSSGDCAEAWERGYTEAYMRESIAQTAADPYYLEQDEQDMCNYMLACRDIRNIGG